MGLSRFSARDARAVPDFIYELFPVLREMKQRRGGDLSGGQQQQLAIGRALASQPRLLILDEPTEGIQPSVIKEIGTVVRSLAARGDMAILLVEQFYDFAAELADQYLVMARGEIVQQAATATWRARACAGWWRFERTGTHCRWRNRGLRWQSLCPRLSAGGRNDRHSAPGRPGRRGLRRALRRRRLCPVDRGDRPQTLADDPGLPRGDRQRPGPHRRARRPAGRPAGDPGNRRRLPRRQPRRASRMQGPGHRPTAAGTRRARRDEPRLPLAVPSTPTSG